MLVPVTAVRQGTPTVAGDSAPVLAGSTSVGAVAVTLNVVPDNLTVGSFVAIDAYTTECEIRTVTAINGFVLSVAALRFAHAIGDAAQVVSDSVPISLYGVTGTGSNEWGPLQRLVLEATPLKLRVDGYERPIGITQPLVFPTSGHTSRMYIRALSSFAPVDVDGGAITVANRTGSCTATAADNTFTTPAAHGFGAGSQILLAAPYGETLPGSIVAGRFYWVKSVPTTTTFTISATDGGAEFDITSDGTATYFQSIGATTLVRVYWESFRLDLEADNLNGFVLDLQQPSWTRNTRIEMTPATVGAIGWVLTGQQSYHENLEVNTEDNCVGIQIEGTGHIVRGINCNGLGGTAVKISGDANHISDLWTETMDVGCEIYGTARAIVIDGTWVGAMPDATSPMLLVSADSTSYKVGMMRIQASGFLFISDTARGISLYSDTGADSVGDAGLAFAGLRQPYGSLAPILTDRRHTVTSSSAAVTHGQGFIEVNATGGAKTMTLPATSGWLGWTVSVCNASTSGTNLVTVNCSGAETIEGSASVTIAVGATVTFVSCGGFYRRASQYP